MDGTKIRVFMELGSCSCFCSFYFFFLVKKLIFLFSFYRKLEHLCRIQISLNYEI